MSPLEDYLWDIVQSEVISKFTLPYQILIILIAVVFILLCAHNRNIFDKWVKIHHKTLNRVLIIILSILILCLVTFFIVDIFYSPKPPEDRLVVAISPFYLIDEYGKTGSDINTAIDFKERIKGEKDLDMDVILLDLDENNLIHDSEDAKYQGKKVGAHLVIYGETRYKAWKEREVKCYICPLSSLEIIPSRISSLAVRTEEGNGLIITKKATFSMITEEPITIIESLKENVSSVIYTIGAFERYGKANFTSAITFFTSIKDYENNSLILHYIGNCYYSNNNLNRSLQYFDKAIAIDPQSANSWYNKGAALADLGRNEEAIAAYDKAIEIDPQLAAAWYTKGVALTYLGRNEEAIAAYDKTIEIKPQYGDAWNNKGVALADLGKNEEAIAAYDKAIAIDPQLAYAWNNKENDLADLGRNEEAIAAYDKAIEIDPQLAVAWNNKGNDLADLGRNEEAIAAYDKAIEIDPQLAVAWNNKGGAFGKLGRNEEAIAAYDKAIEIAPQLAVAWNNKGVALGNLGRHEEAKEVFVKAHEIDPTIEIP